MRESEFSAPINKTPGSDWRIAAGHYYNSNLKRRKEILWFSRGRRRDNRIRPGLLGLDLSLGFKVAERDIDIGETGIQDAAPIAGLPT